MMGGMMGRERLASRSVGQSGLNEAKAGVAGPARAYAATDAKAASRPESGPVALGFQAANPRDLQANLRQIGSKTFYFKDNRWIDSTVRPEEEAKAQIIRQFSDKFFDLARSQSAEMNQYLTFTEPVTLKLAGTVYRIDPAESKP